MRSRATEPVPEAAVLSAGPGSSGSRSAGRARHRDRADQPARKASIDDLIRALGIKGFATAQGAADAMASTPDQVQPLLDSLVVDGLAASTPAPTA